MGGRFWYTRFRMVQQEWDQVALQAHELIICYTLVGWSDMEEGNSRAFFSFSLFH